MPVRPLALASVVLAFSTEAFALLFTPDFRRVVKEADLCVYGRVTLARELPADATARSLHFHYAAELEVESVVFDLSTEGQRITVYYGGGTVDDTSFAPGETHVLFLAELPPPLGGYELPQIHWSVFRFPDRGPMEVPKKLRDPPVSRDLGDFRDEILYIRGPEISVQPTKPSFRWDEDITIEVTFRNPSFREMKLVFAPPPLAHYSFFDQYLSAEGLPICRAGALREADDPKPVEVVLGAMQLVTRSVAIPPHFKEMAKYSLASIAHVTLAYTTGCVKEVEGAWRGAAYSALAPIRIVCDDAEFERRLSGVGEGFALTLVRHSKEFVTGGPIKVTVIAAHKAAPASERWLLRSAFLAGGCGVPRLQEDQVAAVANRLDVRRNGGHIQGKNPDPQKIPWLPALFPDDRQPRHGGWDYYGVELDLAQHFDMSRPGRYSVRLTVPPDESGEEGSLSSNLLEFTLAEPAAE